MLRELKIQKPNTLFRRYLAQVNNDSSGAIVKDKHTAKLKVGCYHNKVL